MPWPPLILVGVVVAGMIAQMAVPVGLPGGVPRRVVGAAMVATGLGLDVWAMLIMARSQANILPHRAATALVTSGPFAVSRNPIYLGNAAFTVGLALGLGSAWLLVAVAAEVALVTVLAIVREEAHLQAAFGAPFEEYRRQTFRWLGRRRRGPLQRRGDGS